MSASLGGLDYTPVPGDFDVDLKTDLAVYQESTGNWYVMLSGSAWATTGTTFGGSGSSPVWLRPAGF